MFLTKSSWLSSISMESEQIIGIAGTGAVAPPQEKVTRLPAPQIWMSLARFDSAHSRKTDKKQDTQFISVFGMLRATLYVFSLA